MLQLKALGYRNVQQVGRGMFGWCEAGMPIEAELADMPPANDEAEEETLKRLGYTKDGTRATCSTSSSH